MTKKESIIKYITKVNISGLEVILDDDKSYMEVSKKLFIKELKSLFNTLKSEGVTSFSKVVSGVCKDGNYGSTFITEDSGYLDVVIDDKNNEINNICLGKNLANKEKVEKENNLGFCFYEDEKVNFKPTQDFLIKQKLIDEATTELNKFVGKTIEIDVICNWYNHYKSLVNVDIFSNSHKAFCDYSFLIMDTFSISRIKKEHPVAIKALSEFNNIGIKDEKSIEAWLLKYKRNRIILHSYDPDEFGTNIILFSNSTNILIDCSAYKESIEFASLYNDLDEKYLKSY